MNKFKHDFETLIYASIAIACAIGALTLLPGCAKTTPTEVMEVSLPDCNVITKARLADYATHGIAPIKSGVQEFPEGVLQFIILASKDGADIYIEGVAAEKTLAAALALDGFKFVVTCQVGGRQLDYYVIRISQLKRQSTDNTPAALAPGETI